MINQVLCREDDFRETIAVQVVKDQRVDEVGLVGGRDLLGQNLPEGRFAAPRLDGQVTGVNSFDGSRLFIRLLRRPIHNEVPLQNCAFRARLVGQLR